MQCGVPRARVYEIPFSAKEGKRCSRPMIFSKQKSGDCHHGTAGTEPSRGSGDAKQSGQCDWREGERYDGGENGRNERRERRNERRGEKMRERLSEHEVE